MKIKLLVIIDRPKWALHRQFLGFKPFLPENYEGTLALANNVAELQMEQADIIYLSSWNMEEWYPRLKPLCAKYYKKIIAGIHSHFSFEQPNGPRTLPERDVDPSSATVKNISRFKAVGAISRRLQRLFSAHLSTIYYLKAGVDPYRFNIISPVEIRRPRLRIGWAGSIENQPGNRGYDEILLPLRLKHSDVFNFVYCIEHLNAHSFARMINYYNSIDIYLCTSRSEGASSTIREALACGRPVITTHVGDTSEIIMAGQNGLLIPEWSLDATLSILTMVHQDRELLSRLANQARMSIYNGWTWGQVTPHWIDAFESVLT